jgi:hypothetical protein
MQHLHEQATPEYRAFHVQARHVCVLRQTIRDVNVHVLHAGQCVPLLGAATVIGVD